MPSATLLEFARANDAAAATTKKLQKQAVLAEYFRGLTDDEDLRRAVRYAAGRPFAATDERVLNVGGALVSEVVLGVLKIPPADYHDLVLRSGEIGDAIGKVWHQRPGAPRPSVPSETESPAAPPRDPDDAHAAPDDNPHTRPAAHPASLTLSALARGFDSLASTGAWERKREILYDLFSRCHDGREAAYLAKIIFGDLRTGVQEGVLHDAIARAFGREAAEVRRCQLLVGDQGEVAVLARQGACASATFRLFHPIQFMLATPQETADDAEETIAGRTFFAEDKLDGIRAQIHKSGPAGDGARVAVYTRTMDRADASFPDVVEAVRGLPGDVLLDGEIVPYARGEVLPFAHIQKRLGRKVLTAKILRDNPAVFVAFDILYKDGDLLMDRPLCERRRALDALVPDQLPPPAGAAVDAEGSGNGQASHLPRRGPILLATAVAEVASAGQIDAAFCRARDCRNEGLILKDPDSIYSPGRRGQAWLKLKSHLPTFDCVVTAAEYGHGKRKNWLSDYTFAVWDRDPAEPGATLVNIGKAYSGVTDEEIKQLTELFLGLSLGQNGWRHVVEPKLVLEIACDQIQKSGRHASGFALRFPRIKRVRWDKRPEDADRLPRIVEIYESLSNTAKGRHAPEPPPAPEPTLFDGLA